ncbi:MAG: Si-specific NAD(P)(+) transhydrogenase [Planctomycetes bacterium]|nr:Si-specific NAD(P)(+) transhydrogenase [Planctomycetota bacterium]
MDARYDLVVLGSGPAGIAGAEQAAHFGKRVALVERTAFLGGAGINTGTVPSKTLRETALYFSGLKQRGLYGLDYTLRPNLTIAGFLYREKHVVEELRESARARLDRKKVEVVWGSATLLDATTVRVELRDGGSRDLKTGHVLLATGSAPFHLPGIPFEEEDVYDSDELLSMDYIPQTLAVFGAGVIGCEYASIFQALDVKVTLVEMRDRMLTFMDAEVVDRLRARFEQLGMTIRFNDRVAKVICMQPGIILHMENGQQVAVDKALFATGRQSNVQGLRLPEAGVSLGERGLVKVNEHFQTTVPTIYAAGDVIGFPALASTGMEQARVAICHAFDLRYKQRVSPVLPFAMYTIPELSMVGKTEEELKKDGTPYVVGRASYANTSRGQILGDLTGLVKLLVRPDDRRVLGVHILGEAASDLIHLGAACMQVGGTVDWFIDAVYNYPSLTETYKNAAYHALTALDAT